MLKEAHKNQNLADIERATEALNNAWHAASEDMARAAQQQGPQDPGAGFGGGFQGGQQGPQDGGSSDNNGPEDVDYEEVK